MCHNNQAVLRGRGKGWARALRKEKYRYFGIMKKRKKVNELPHQKYLKALQSDNPKGMERREGGQGGRMGGSS